MKNMDCDTLAYEVGGLRLSSVSKHFVYFKKQHAFFAQLNLK
jgi:hypothetical protein